jgi:hypothetical protein
MMTLKMRNTNRLTFTDPQEDSGDDLDDDIIWIEAVGKACKRASQMCANEEKRHTDKQDRSDANDVRKRKASPMVSSGTAGKRTTALPAAAKPFQYAFPITRNANAPNCAPTINNTSVQRAHIDAPVDVGAVCIDGPVNAGPVQVRPRL